MTIISQKDRCNLFLEHSLQASKYKLSRLCPVRDFLWTIDKTNYMWNAGGIPDSLLGIFGWIKDTIMHARNERILFPKFKHQYNLGKFIHIRASVNLQDSIEECTNGYNACSSSVPRVRSVLSAMYLLSQKYEWVPEAILVDAETDMSRVRLLILIPDHFRLEPYFESS